MWVAWLCVLLAGCGPVMLGEEAHARADGGASSDAGDSEREAAPPATDSSVPSASAQPLVVVRVTPLDCGVCFALRAEGAGGQPPYTFQWADGASGAERRVCIRDAAVPLSVSALDAANVRSSPQAIRLERAGDASCPEPAAPPDAGMAPLLCLENGSFEGTASLSPDIPFDAEPWSLCTTAPQSATNTPVIANESLSFTGTAPAPTDGLTYVALAEGQQVTQELCSEVSSDEPLFLRLDLSTIDISGGVAPTTERVFVELWGGLSVDCSQRELLWASRSLRFERESFCVALRPRSFITQVTLLARSDMTSLSPAYVLIDNVQPVESCP